MISFPSQYKENILQEIKIPRRQETEKKSRDCPRSSGSGYGDRFRVAEFHLDETDLTPLCT